MVTKNIEQRKCGNENKGWKCKFCRATEERNWLHMI